MIMSDLWEELRNKINPDDTVMWIAQEEVENLLADADALLTMKENIQSVMYYLTIELKDTEGDGPEFQGLQRLVNILTALPEHLKAADSIDDIMSPRQADQTDRR